MYYILHMTPDSETVLVYGDADMDEVFSEAERDGLANGHTVERSFRHGFSLYTDMTIAARNAAFEAA